MTCGAQVVGRLQRLLAALWDVPALAPIGPHLMGPEALTAMPGANFGLPEQVFVASGAQARGEVALSVYIAPEVLTHLAGDDPFVRLHTGNLESFFVALEGVSHFLMVVWRAAFGLPVRALELEIQAEADKFIVAALLASHSGHLSAQLCQALYRCLFEEAQWRPALPPGERERYVLANRAAATFCQALLAGAAPGPRRGELVQAARRYVRWPLARKLRLAEGML